MKRFAFADGLRGFAALWVVLFHMSQADHIPSLRAVTPGWLWALLFDWGELGVPIFFVLSGFVMAVTAEKLSFDAGVAGRFVLRRLIRLSPPYYLAIAIAVASVYFKARVLGNSSPVIEPAQILEHVTYLSLMFSHAPINPVFWTLCIEVQFYVAFALLMWAADRSGLQGARPWIVGVNCALALLWPMGLIETPIWTGGFVGFWHAFLAGVGVWWGGRTVGRARYLAAGYCTLLVVIGTAEGGQFTVAAGWAGMALLAAGALGKMGDWLSGPWLQRLGAISYSLYLLHGPFTGVSFRLLRKWLPATPATDFAALIIVIGICLVGAWLAYWLIERPSIAWSHAVRFQPQPQPVVAATRA